MELNPLKIENNQGLKKSLAVIAKSLNLTLADYSVRNRSRKYVGHVVYDHCAVYIEDERLPAEYAIKVGDASRRLWTTDGDGNPVARSCFRIE